MKTVLRVFIYLGILVWLGSDLFFPIVAKISFTVLASQTRLAGEIVGASLAVVHHEAVVCAVIIAIALIGAHRAGIYTRGSFRSLLALVVLMLAVTAASELAIIPKMQAYRANFGAFDSALPNDPNRAAFDALHKASEYAEEAVVLFGLAFVVVLAIAEGKNKAVASLAAPAPVHQPNESTMV